MSPLETSIIEVVKEHFGVFLNEDEILKKLEDKVKEERDKLGEDFNRKFATKDNVNQAIKDWAQEFKTQIESIPKEQQGGTTQTIRIEEVVKEEVRTKDLDVSRLHTNTPQLVKFISAKLPVYMYGPTGSSKTNVVFRIAKALEIPIQSVTVSPQTPKSELLGYKDAHGNYQEGVCYKPFTEGGILLVNELDNGNAASNAVLNQLMDEAVFFPCGMKERNKDFIMIATANTLGNGANRQYVGRSPQDKALLNRFVYLHWPWDKKLERLLATEEYFRYGGKEEREVTRTLNSFWRFRAAVEELQLDHIMSMRNLLQFVRLKAIGVDDSTATRCCVARGLDKEQYTKIVNKARTIAMEDIEDVQEGNILGAMKELPAPSKSTTSLEAPF